MKIQKVQIKLKKLQQVEFYTEQSTKMIHLQNMNIYSKNYINEPFNIVLNIYHNHNDINLEGITPKYIPFKNNYN